MRKKCELLGLGLSCCISFVGCAGYRLGPSNGEVAGQKAVAVGWFVNKTEEPRLGDALNRSLRKRFQQDATWRLSTHGGADIVVQGVLTRFERQPLSFQPNDVVSTRDYLARLTAHVEAIETQSGRVVLNRDFVGHTPITKSTDPASAERQALPLIADDLAVRIVSALVDGPWP